jgi:fatty-acyl-CoA synthase
MTNPYNTNLDKNSANYQPLTPISFLERAADVFPNHTAIIHGSLKQTYSDFYLRSKKLASALIKKNISRGNTVSTLLLNTPAMLEAHYGIPMCGSVIHAINTRIEASAIAFQLDHADSKILIFDKELSSLVNEALSLVKSLPILIQYNDTQCDYNNTNASVNHEVIDYENFLETGDDDFQWLMPEDEWDAISVGYTSGTTGNPKGVVSHHRGAYLLAQGNALVASMEKHSVYLWTLPMFHCNGWCFPWTMSTIIGTHICLRQVRAESIWNAIKENDVTHLCGAPIVMSVILSLENKDQYKSDKEINFFTAAAPPPESVLIDMKHAGFNVTHLYGLTETYGPAVINEWHSDWNALDSSSQATLKARQGVRYLPLEGLDVLDPKNMKAVPRDGKTIGEVMFKGNIVMKGYLKNKKANDEAFLGGWFHSGDLAVLHEDGYIQLKDRSKDIIISGGENISSIEIEEVLSQHPNIISAAVVAMSDEKWGERPCAFIEMKTNANITEDEASNWCKAKLAGFKVPKKFIFEAIPKTSTGKVQKYILRKRAESIFLSKSV